MRLTLALLAAAAAATAARVHRRPSGEGQGDLDVRRVWPDLGRGQPLQRRGTSACWRTSLLSAARSRRAGGSLWPAAPRATGTTSAAAHHARRPRSSSWRAACSTRSPRRARPRRPWSPRWSSWPTARSPPARA